MLSEARRGAATECESKDLLSVSATHGYAREFSRRTRIDLYLTLAPETSAHLGISRSCAIALLISWPPHFSAQLFVSSASPWVAVSTWRGPAWG